MKKPSFFDREDLCFACGVAAGVLIASNQLIASLAVSFLGGAIRAISKRKQ